MGSQSKSWSPELTAKQSSALTPARLCSSPGWLAGATLGVIVTSWNYRNLVGVQTHKGMRTGAVILQAPGQAGQNASYWATDNKSAPHKAPNAIPVAGNWKVVQERVAVLGRLIEASQAPTPQPQSDPVLLGTELEKLGQLRAANVLSEDEFLAAKKRLLD